MTRKERIITQRALMAEAFGKIEAVSEYFGGEDELSDISEYNDWCEKVKLFKEWVYNESPIC